MDAAPAAVMPEGELSESGMGLAIIHALVDRVEIGPGVGGSRYHRPHAPLRSQSRAPSRAPRPRRPLHGRGRVSPDVMGQRDGERQAHPHDRSAVLGLEADVPHERLHDHTAAAALRALQGRAPRTCVVHLEVHAAVAGPGLDANVAAASKR